MKKSMLLGLFTTIFFCLIPFINVSAVSYSGTTVEAESDNVTYEVTASTGDVVTLSNLGSGSSDLAITFATDVGGSIVVTESTSRPSDASVNPEGDVNLYFDVELVGLTNDDITGAVWTFTVEKSWLDANGVTSVNIFLQHFNDGAWERLTTTEVSSTDTTVTFEAKVNSFSTFAVTAVEGLSNTGSPYMLGALLSISALVVIGGSFMLSRKYRNNN